MLSIPIKTVVPIESVQTTIQYLFGSVSTQAQHNILNDLQSIHHADLDTKSDEEHRQLLLVQEQL